MVGERCSTNALLDALMVSAVLVLGLASRDTQASSAECHTRQPPPTTLTSPSPTTSGAPPVLYVNATGSTLVAGGFDDASVNQTVWSDQAGAYPPYEDQAEAAEIIGVVAERLAPYDIAVTDTRPESGPYTMIMLGPGNGSGGFATLDCGNVQPSNIGFVYSSASDGDPLTTGILVAHEAGHTFGLDHVDDASKIMNPFVYEDAQWASNCFPHPSEGVCADVHTQHCGAGQNSHAELLAAFGPSVMSEDTLPSTIAFIEPADGQTVSSEFQLRVALADDGFGLGAAQGTLDGMTFHDGGAMAEHTWSFFGIEAGAHTVEITATDLVGNTATAEIVVIVEGEETSGLETDSVGPAESGSTTTVGGGGTGTSDADTSTGAPEPDATTSAPALPDTDGGSAAGTSAGGCHVGEHAPFSAAFASLGLMLLGGTRRRRAPATERRCP